MEPAVFLVALLSTVGIAAFTVVKVARLFATRRESPSPDVTARLEEVERSVQGGSISQSVYSASHGKNRASAASEDSTDCAAYHALEAAGRWQVRKNCVASLASRFICGSTALRQHALRPQLKRDPLGGGGDRHQVAIP